MFLMNDDHSLKSYYYINIKCPYRPFLPHVSESNENNWCQCGLWMLKQDLNSSAGAVLFLGVPKDDLVEFYRLCVTSSSI